MSREIVEAVRELERDRNLEGGILVDALRDRKRSHRPDHFDRALAEAVEVAGEERVRTAELTGAAHRAVHVVLGDVLDR